MPFFLPSVNAELGTFKAGENISLIQTCNTCTYCNITNILRVTPINTSLILGQQAMTKQGTFYNFTLNNTYTNLIGEYQYCYECADANNIATGCVGFSITHAGVSPSTAQSGLSLGILISMILIMFFFGLIGFKLIDYEKLYPVGVFFLIVAIIIAVYGLYLGVVYSRDYLYLSTSAPQIRLFLAITYGLVGMAFIVLLVLMIDTLKEIKERKSMQKYGDNWDTKTKQYNY